MIKAILYIINYSYIQSTGDEIELENDDGLILTS